MKDKIQYIIKNYKITGIVITIIFALSFIIYFQHVNVVNLKSKNVNEIMLRNALLDTVSRYKNERDEWVNEKLVLQETMKNLDKITGQLNSMQKELVLRIKEVETKNDVIAAALFMTNVKIDSLSHKGETIVDTETKTIKFRDLYRMNKREVQYSFIIGGVLPVDLKIKPTLFIDSLYFPNTQYIDFKWKRDKKTGYPVSFSVINSNEFFKTGNVESYMIPNITKEHLNPNGWQKFENFLIRNGNKTIYIGVGIGIGVAGTLLLMK